MSPVTTGKRSLGRHQEADEDAQDGEREGGGPQQER